MDNLDKLDEVWFFLEKLEDMDWNSAQVEYIKRLKDNIQKVQIDISK